MAEQDSLSEEQLRGEFHAQTASIAWHELQPHYARGSVVLVEAGLDLVDVALRLRVDDKASFEAWIEQGLISGISDDLGQQWFTENPTLWAVVVPPWVLVQRRSD